MQRNQKVCQIIRGDEVVSTYTWNLYCKPWLFRIVNLLMCTKITWPASWIIYLCNLVLDGTYNITEFWSPCKESCWGIPCGKYGCPRARRCKLTGAWWGRRQQHLSRTEICRAQWYKVFFFFLQYFLLISSWRKKIANDWLDFILTEGPAFVCRLSMSSTYQVS